MLFELERHNVRAITHNRMLRLTVTRLQEHTAALEAALKAKYFDKIRSDDFFGRDQGDNLRILQDAFEDVDATLCHYVHPPGSKFQRPPRDYRDSHLWHVMPLSRRPLAPASCTSAFRRELARNRALRDDDNPTLQKAAIHQRCVDPSSLPVHVVDLTDESSEAGHAVQLLDAPSSDELSGYPIDLPFSEMTALSEPYESLLVKTSHPACELRRSIMTQVSMDFARLVEDSASLPSPDVGIPLVAGPSTVDLPSLPTPTIHSPASTVVLESPSDDDSLFGGVSGSEWSDAVSAGTEPLASVARSQSSSPVVNPSHRRASSYSPTSSPEPRPTKRLKTTSRSPASSKSSRVPQSSKSSAPQKSSKPKSSNATVQLNASQPPNAVTMRNPKPGMFSRDIPLGECQVLCQVAGSYVLGHPDYFQSHPLVTPQRTLGEWTKDDRPTLWRTEAMLKSIIAARPWRKMVKRWPRPPVDCSGPCIFTLLS